MQNIKKTFFFFVERGKIIKIKKIIKGKEFNFNIKDDLNNTALHVACNLGNFNVVKFLVEKGADVNVKNNYTNKTPLQIAKENGYKRITKYLKQNSAEE